MVSLGNGSLTQSGKHKQILIVPKHVGVLKEGDPLDGQKQKKRSRKININIDFLRFPMTSYAFLGVPKTSYEFHVFIRAKKIAFGDLWGLL